LPKRYFSKLLEAANTQLGSVAEDTMGLAVPKRGSKTACLCSNGTYSKGCCRERLIQQGIGATQGEALPTYAFQRPSFSNAFS
jgi:hypothetical protein